MALRGVGDVNFRAISNMDFDALKGLDFDAIKGLDLDGLRGIDLDSLKGLDFDALKGLDFDGIRGLNLNAKQLSALDALSTMNLKSLDLGKPDAPKLSRNIGRNIGLAAIGVAIVDQIAFGGGLIAKVFGFGGKATEETIKVALNIAWNAIDSFLSAIFGKQWKYFVMGFIILVALLYIYRLIRK
jgi:hypothetical protein